jgi:hypothetical protein
VRYAFKNLLLPPHSALLGEQRKPRALALQAFSFTKSARYIRDQIPSVSFKTYSRMHSLSLHPWILLSHCSVRRPQLPKRLQIAICNKSCVLPFKSWLTILAPSLAMFHGSVEALSLPNSTSAWTGAMIDRLTGVLRIATNPFSSTKLCLCVDRRNKRQIGRGAAMCNRTLKLLLFVSKSSLEAAVKSCSVQQIRLLLSLNALPCDEDVHWLRRRATIPPVFLLDCSNLG